MSVWPGPASETGGALGETSAKTVVMLMFAFSVIAALNSIEIIVFLILRFIRFFIISFLGYIITIAFLSLNRSAYLKSVGT